MASRGATPNSRVPSPRTSRAGATRLRPAWSIGPSPMSPPGPAMPAHAAEAGRQRRPRRRDAAAKPEPPGQPRSGGRRGAPAGGPGGRRPPRCACAAIWPAAAKATQRGEEEELVADPGAVARAGLAAEAPDGLFDARRRRRCPARRSGRSPRRSLPSTARPPTQPSATQRSSRTTSRALLSSRRVRARAGARRTSTAAPTSRRPARTDRRARTRRPTSSAIGTSASGCDAGQRAQLLDPAERARPAQPAGAGDRVGDQPDQVGGREDGGGERRWPAGASRPSWLVSAPIARNIAALAVAAVA